MRVFIVHGWEGNPNVNWFPWLKKELEKKGINVEAPAMPDTTNPNVDAWVGYLKKVVGTPDEKTYFVGHSLGCITIIRYLETLPPAQKIGGAVFVAGFTSDIGFPELMGFLEKPVNYGSVKRHCDKFAAINSDNDKYVPLSQGETLRDKLGAKLKVKHLGHFNDHEDGVYELPDVLAALDEMMSG